MNACPHFLNARALFSIRQSPGCLMFTVGIPWKVVFLFWDRFQFIDFLSFVAVTACNSYRRSHLPRHIGHAGFVQQRIRWWPGWWFIQCSPPVGGVVRVCRGSGNILVRYFFIHYKHIEAEIKWPPFSRRHFQMHFPEWKYMNFD